MPTRINEAGEREPFFRDENGKPSDHHGPDLSKAEPIEAVIARLNPLRSAYSVEFWKACKASGLHLSVTVTRDGEEQLGMMYPCDSQMDLRKPRGEALTTHMNRSERRHRDVVALVNILGHFADNQPYPSVEEAADAFLEAGGRLMVRPDGKLEDALNPTIEQLNAEHYDGWPLRRLSHRLDATLRQKGGREAMAALVRERGELHQGTGWIVLKKAAPAEAVSA